MVLVKGLPPEAVDPHELEQFFEDILSTPIIGASIAYDFTGREEEIQKLLDEHLEQRESEFAAELGVPMSSRAQRDGRRRRGLAPVREGDEAEAGTTPRMSREDEDSEVGRPLNVGSDDDSPGVGLLATLRNSGEAFLVLRREEDVERLFALWDQPWHHQRMTSFFSFDGAGTLDEERTGLSPTKRAAENPECVLPPVIHEHRKFHGAELQLREVTSEPTSVVWEHMGTPREVMWQNGVVAASAFLASIFAFYLLLFYPLAQYVLQFTQAAGEPPTAWQTRWLGIVVGAGNSLIANCIWLGVPQLGFRRKDQADIVTFLMRSLLVLSNTLVMVTFTAWKLSVALKPEESMRK